MMKSLLREFWTDSGYFDKREVNNWDFVERAVVWGYHKAMARKKAKK